MSGSEKLSASLENYLEVIYHLEAKSMVARVRDIAKSMNVKSSSVTYALKVLAEKKLINYEPYSVITLTKEGRKVAGGVVQRHEVLKKFLESVLNLNCDLAEDTACKMEHSISTTVLERLTQFLEYIDSCPRGEINWVNNVGFFCKNKLDDGTAACMRHPDDCDVVS